MKKQNYQKPKKTKTSDVYRSFTGIRYLEDVPANDYRLGYQGCYYVGEDVWVFPNGDFKVDQGLHDRKRP